MPSSNNPGGQFYNSGYEHLKSIYLLKEAQALAPLKASSAYILPLMAMQNACLAIEEYVNQTGQKVDPAWEQPAWEDAPIQVRLAHVYQKMRQPIDFTRGIWKEVLSLFEIVELVNEDLSAMENLQRDSIPENLKQIAVDYPIYRSQAIAEEAVDLLLEQSEINNPVPRNSTVAK